jgi:hypothetical protein
MLFFDLEAYAPPGDRNASLSSLIVNPARPGHLLLGGSFFSKRFEDPIPEVPEVQGLWLWNFESEAALLTAIKARFEEEGRRQREEKVWVLGKPLYPKTTREMAGRLGLRERKGSSKGVWESYESRDHRAIEQRTEHGLRLVLDLYKAGYVTVEGRTSMLAPTCRGRRGEMLEGGEGVASGPWTGGAGRIAPGGARCRQDEGPGPPHSRGVGGRASM